nr:ATP-binding protein [uncultured Cupriavidus sp.]
MLQRLPESVAERSRFLVAVSHDLRSPVPRLRLRAEALPLESLRECFRKDLEEMELMIGATLDFVQGIRVDEARQWVDVDTLARAVAEDMVDAGGQVSVQDLVENAVRYGGSQCTIDFRTQSGACSEAMVDIVVADKGPGISEGDLEPVFEPFFRLEASRNRSTGGVGLGLAIARTIVQRPMTVP